MKILIGSLSARKVDVCQTVFARYLPREELLAQGCPVQSGVSETPWGQETCDGARNRARACPVDAETAFAVGLESGLVERFGVVFEEAWCCIRDARTSREYLAFSSGLRIPNFVLDRMKLSGRAHYEEMAVIEKEFGLPHDTWSNYTGGLILREVSLEEAIRNALVQILSACGLAP